MLLVAGLVCVALFDAYTFYVCVTLLFDAYTFFETIISSADG
jgi:hypothetical protein